MTEVQRSGNSWNPRTTRHEARTVSGPDPMPTVPTDYWPAGCSVNVAADSFSGGELGSRLLRLGDLVDDVTSDDSLQHFRQRDIFGEA